MNITKTPEPDCCQEPPRNTARDYVEIAAAVVVLIGAVLLLRSADVQRAVHVSESMSYGLVFLIGLAASVSTCIAVTGGLLVAFAAKFNETVAQLGAGSRVKPHVFFNVGRLVSYAVFGALIGALGSALALSPEINGVLMVLASAAMIVIGLQMLRLLPPLGLARSMLPERWRAKLQEYATSRAGPAAFLFGASTFFLPCGFTQALQLYVLAKASAWTGMLTMFVFALGTLPALVSLSAISSFATGGFQRYFLKGAGVAVVLLGLLNIEYGLVSFGGGVNVASMVERFSPKADTVAAPIVDGKQTVQMRVVGLEYEPNRFIVTQGVPVVWVIDAKEAEGCGRVLRVPKLRIGKMLYPDRTNIVTFTPTETGEIEFNCAMGMMTPNSKFSVISNPRG